MRPSPGTGNLRKHMNINSDLEGMQLALQWAEKGLFTTSPNPRSQCEDWEKW